MSYWLWMLASGYCHPLACQAAALGVTLTASRCAGNCSIKWVLVILTFEGAVRIASRSLCIMAWKRL